MVQFEYVVYEISEKINGMIRSPNDGVHLETPQAQTQASAAGVAAGLVLEANDISRAVVVKGHLVGVVVCTLVCYRRRASGLRFH